MPQTDAERAVREAHDWVCHMLGVAWPDQRKTHDTYPYECRIAHERIDHAIEAMRKEPRTATELSTLESDTLERRMRDWKDQMEAVRHDENEALSQFCDRHKECQSVTTLIDGSGFTCAACDEQFFIHARISKEVGGA